MPTTKPVTVELESWHDKKYGPRFTLLHEGKAVQTFGTEFEARQVARQHGWEIVAVLGEDQ